MGKKWWLGCFHFATWSHFLNWIHHGKKKLSQIPKENCTWDHVFCGELGYTFLMTTSILAQFGTFPYEVVKGKKNRLNPNGELGLCFPSKR